MFLKKDLFKGIPNIAFIPAVILVKTTIPIGIEKKNPSQPSFSMLFIRCLILIKKFGSRVVKYPFDRI